MRARFFRFTTVAVAIAAAAACASSEDEVSSQPPGPDGGGQTPLPDGGDSATDASVDRAAPADATAPESGSLQTCSAAGWCITELPDEGLNIAEIWPLEKNAFATAFSTARGRKIIEWREDAPDAGWQFIDDNTQQDIPGGVFENIWAPNEDEVYYTAGLISDTLTGTRGGFLYHGKRPLPPATNWTWTRTQFDCALASYPRILGIGSEIYMLSCQKIYRLTGDPDAPDAGIVGDAGSSAWTLEYTDDDPAALQFKGGVGTPDDILFVGRRGSCTTIVRKTETGYRRIVDGISSGLNCNAKPGYPRVASMIDFLSIVPGEIVGTVLASGSNNDFFVKVVVDGQGEVSVTEHRPQSADYGSLWSDSPDEVWVVSNSYRIMHGTGDLGDASSYQHSTIALNGLPNENVLSRIRGTSKSNLWATGSDRVFHKTTP